MTTTERYEELLMCAVDGALSPDEQVELDALLDADPDRREEYEDMLTIKSVTDDVVHRILADAQLEPPRETPGERRLSRLSMGLIIGGLGLVLGWMGFELASDPGVPMAIKIGLGAALLGAALFVIRLLGKRSRKRDPYLEIDQ